MTYEVKKFKDHQVSAKIIKEGSLHVKVRGNSYEDLFKAATIKEAWDADNSTIKNTVAILTIYCLIGQRSDRRFNAHESFDLKVIASFINSMNFDKVEIFHPHSPIALILNSCALDHYQYVEKTYLSLDSPVLVSPDAGAYKTTHEIAEKLGADLIPSNKVRINGLPSISIQGDVKGRECLIIDDLADGGRTFKFLAEELKVQGATNIYLHVTHAQFNYGFEELKEVISHFYCTNSFRDIDEAFVTQYKVVE